MLLQANDVAQLAIRLNLVTENQLMECWPELESKTEPGDNLLRILERKAFITSWQRSKLVKGDKDGYFLGGYRLLYKISSGTFGRVFRADDPRTGEIVAVKVLRQRWMVNPQKIELFEREGKMGLSIRHPNVVSILAVNRDPMSGQYYIVMEFVEGGNLRDFLSIRKQLSPFEALRILDEATNGLAYSYSRGMTHRDIKPTNILISAQGISKLVDFGLAEITQNVGHYDEMTVDQSVDYAGLEQATNCKSGDIRSDIYFLGCTLYQMLTGKPLLTITKDLRARKSRARFDVVAAIDQTHPNIPPAMYSLLTRMVAIEPFQRIQTPTLLLEAIQNVRNEISGESLKIGGNAEVIKTIYVVEHHAKLQDVFREKFKEAGFRVLISVDADRAIQRYKQMPFQVLLIDVGTAGEESLDVFERVLNEAEQHRMECVGILILSEDQATWKTRIKKRDGVHVFVRPVTMKQIIDVLA